jgi:hypothetical protein
MRWIEVIGNLISLAVLKAASVFLKFTSIVMTTGTGTPDRIAGLKR